MKLDVSLLTHNALTHWGHLDTFSIVFSSEELLHYNWNSLKFILSDPITGHHHWFRWQAATWTTDDPVQFIDAYMSLSFDTVIIVKFVITPKRWLHNVRSKSLHHNYVMCLVGVTLMFRDIAFSLIVWPHRLPHIFLIVHECLTNTYDNYFVASIIIPGT